MGEGFKRIRLCSASSRRGPKEIRMPVSHKGRLRYKFVGFGRVRVENAHLSRREAHSTAKTKIFLQTSICKDGDPPAPDNSV